MTYTILSTTVENEILKTNVQFTLNDGTIITTDIPHFTPATASEVLDNIDNRELTEQNKYDAEQNNLLIKEQIDQEINVPSDTIRTDLDRLGIDITTRPIREIGVIKK